MSEGAAVHRFLEGGYAQANAHLPLQLHAAGGDIHDAFDTD